MSTQSQHVNRTGWASGPWDDEPDNRTWHDGAAGLPCLIRRGGDGQLCGYVGVPREHDLFGVPFSDEDGPFFKVHGSITYAGERPSGSLGPNGYWWFGFDCNHRFDYAPGRAIKRSPPNIENYRTIEYVTRQCAQLAAQLARGISVLPHSHLDEGEPNEP